MKKKKVLLLLFMACLAILFAIIFQSKDKTKLPDREKYKSFLYLVGSNVGKYKDKKRRYPANAAEFKESQLSGVKHATKISLYKRLIYLPSFTPKTLEEISKYIHFPDNRFFNHQLYLTLVKKGALHPKTNEPVYIFCDENSTKFFFMAQSQLHEKGVGKISSTELCDMISGIQIEITPEDLQNMTQRGR